MLDPYRMVAINLIASFLLLIGVISYKFIYPKRNINLLTLLILISILPIISIFRNGDYESGDFNIHIYRMMSFYDSLREGILMPSWAGELNATYGNPLFIFNYSFSYYIVSFFHFVGLSFILSLKVFLALTLFLSGIFMYVWIKKLTDNHLAAFTAGIFYIFNPYHLIDVHFRATPGESSIFVFAPLVLFFVTKYFKEKKLSSLIVISLLTMLMSMGHPLLTITILAITASYTIFTSFINKDKKGSFFVFGSLFIGGIASMHLFVPFILYRPYTFSIPTNYISFPPFELLFFSPWRLGFLFQGPKGELALMIGYAQILILLLGIIIAIKGNFPKKIRRHFLFWTTIFIVLISLMHPSSRPIWNHLLTLGNMFIPFGRLLLPTALATSTIAAYLAIVLSVSKSKKKFLYLIIFITIASTILNWGHRKVIPEINDRTLRDNVWKSTVTEGKTAYFLNTRWADPDNFWFSEKPEKHLEIIEGKGAFREIKRTSILHSYIVDAETELAIKENTLYFPGWTMKIDNMPIRIYPGVRGIINARLPKGSYLIELVYNDLPAYKASKIISLLILFCLLSILSICFVLKKFRRN